MSERGALLALLAVSAAAWAPQLAAQPFAIDQPPTRASSGVSDLDCGFCQSGSLVLAEDLVLPGPGWIADLTIWGGYFDDEVYDDDFRVRIFADGADGLPEPPALVTRSGVPSARQATGLTVPFSGSPVDEYRFTLRLPSPPMLPAGTYWIEIANDSTGQVGEFVWGYGALDAVNGRAGAAQSVSGTVWFPSSADFNLRIPSVPFADGFESGDTGAWTATQP